MITILKTSLTKKGGAEKYARLLAEAFVNQGRDVTVLTSDVEEKDFPYRVVSLQYKSKTSLSKVWEFEAFCEDFLRKNPSQVVFGMDRNRLQTHIRAGSGCHKAYLRHRTLFEPKWKHYRHLLNPLHSTLLHIEKKSFENPDLEKLFVNSNLIKNEILENYIVDPNKIHVIHNGVEWDLWQDHFQTIIPSNHFEFLFIGSNFERKGLRRLLKGLSLLKMSDVHLTVIGSDKNEKSFKKLAKKLKINVTFTGPQSNIIPNLQKADCLVIPSYYDPFANVTTEALAMGLFVISSKTNGGHEVLTPETGTVIEELTSDDSVKKALEIALKHPKTLESAKKIRDSVQYLDFHKQLTPYLNLCLSSIS